MLREEEKEHTRINIVKSLYNGEWLPRKVCVQPVPQPHPEPEHKPKIWMGTKILKNQATQSDPILDEDYCFICTYSGRICPCTWYKFSTDLDWEKLEEETEEDRESDWDADIE